jgi:hypothetical protein
MAQVARLQAPQLSIDLTGLCFSCRRYIPARKMPPEAYLAGQTSRRRHGPSLLNIRAGALRRQPITNDKSRPPAWSRVFGYVALG